MKTSLDDELTLLLAVGTDAPGDVQVVPEGEPLHEVPALVDGEASEDLDFGALVGKVDPYALPGVQEKASTSMISTPLSTGFGRFILKLSQAGFPNLVENEAVHLEAARELKIPVAAAQLITDRTGTSGLLVQRFDRAAHAGTWTRSAFEDATQVMEISPAETYAGLRCAAWNANFGSGAASCSGFDPRGDSDSSPFHIGRILIGNILPKMAFRRIEPMHSPVSAVFCRYGNSGRR